MSNFKHTPGPWKWYWRDRFGDDAGGVYAVDGGIATSVCRAPRYQTKEQWEADARLIAAAPTMHEYIAKRADAGDNEAKQILESINAGR
jgi:hypothetical protein